MCVFASGARRPFALSGAMKAAPCNKRIEKILQRTHIHPMPLNLDILKMRQLQAPFLKIEESTPYKNVASFQERAT
jgi:hypothetical protein